MSSSNSPTTSWDLRHDEIRVLQLAPGNIKDPLSGELETASITHGTLRHAKGTTSCSRQPRRLSSESGDSKYNERGAPLFDSNYTFNSELSRPRSSVQYEAISYAWGNLNKPHSIHIIRGIGEIAITMSLSELLRHFRYVHRQRNLWVDAICIDQNNTAERNRQVRMMADIFAASTTVLVWLGVGEHTDSLAFATIEACSDLVITGTEKDIDLETLRIALCEYTGPHACFRRDLKAQEDVAIAGLASVLDISQAKWFQRLWVVQETNRRIAKKVTFCKGYHAIDRDDSYLWNALFVLQDAARTSRFPSIRADPEALRRIMDHLASSEVTINNGGQTISKFLAYSDKRCYDPRDRVFALRRMLGLESFDDLQPDYGLDHVEVFRRLMCACLTPNSRPIDILKAVGEDAEEYGGEREGKNTEEGGKEDEEEDGNEEDEDEDDACEENEYYIHSALALALTGTELEPRSDLNSPSWVPNLHKLSDASRAKSLLYNRSFVGLRTPDPTFDKNWSSHWHTYEKHFHALVLPESPYLLLLRGRCFADARERCLIPSVPDLGLDSLFADTMRRSHVEIVAKWFTTFCCFVAHCMPNVFDMGLEKDLVSFAFYPTSWIARSLSRKQHEDSIQDLKLLVAAGTDGRMSLSSSLCAELLDISSSLPVCPLASARKLWQVQSENKTDIAWVPAATQMGDEICVVAGAPWPFVVRKVDENSYTLVGDAHLFGTSLTEALKGAQNDAQRQGKFWHGQPLGFNMQMWRACLGSLYVSID